MYEPIMFTPQDIINAILAVCGAITAIAAASAVIVKIITSARRPNLIQDQKIAALEEEVKEIRAEIENRDEKLKERITIGESQIGAIEEANAVTQRAILALLSHAINGNDAESLRKAKTDLENYLTRNKTAK